LVSIQSLLWLDTNAQGAFWSTEKEWHWEMLDEIASLLQAPWASSSWSWRARRAVECVACRPEARSRCRQGRQRGDKAEFRATSSRSLKSAVFGDPFYPLS